MQVHQLDFFAASASSTAGAGEGHGAFRATVTVVPGMIQFILRKQCSVFRGVQLEPDRAEIMTQSGAERLVELRLLVGDPIAASVFDENLSGRIKGEVHPVPGTGITDLPDPFVAAGPLAAIGFAAQVDMFDLP